MPQALSKEWKQQLGSDWQTAHELYLHTLGNLTLTAYNSELSNETYQVKRKLFSESHIELNRSLAEAETWTIQSIKDRAEYLSEIAMKVWPYFGTETDATHTTKFVVGKVPRVLCILGQRYEVATWRDVLELTVETIADLEPEGFARILNEFPRFVGKDKEKFRDVRKLKCGAFVEVNLGAEAIYRFCCQAIEAIGLSADDWQIETAQKSQKSGAGKAGEFV